MESIRGKKIHLSSFITDSSCTSVIIRYRVLQGAHADSVGRRVATTATHVVKLPCPLCMSTVIITDFETRKKFVFPLIRD